MFKRIGLIAKGGDPRVDETLVQLISHLRTRGVDVCIDEGSGVAESTVTGLQTVERAALSGQCDLAVIVGGDGTFLHAARSLAGEPIPLLGINLGRLGFLTDVVPGDLVRVMDQLLDGELTEEQRFLLSARVVRDGECQLEVPALNDVVAHKWRIARLLEFETYVDSKLVNRQRADGVIVSTPTGSTAYALSSGGPVLHPAIDALALVPICPHTLTTRPLVVQGDSEVEIVITDGDPAEAQLTCDGQTNMKLGPGDRIHVKKNPRKLKLVHPTGYDFYSTLRTKLHWGRDLRQ